MKRHFLFIAIFFIISLIMPGNVYGQENTIGVTDISWDATDGYTIFSAGKRTYIINNCGQVINKWESENNVSNSAYLLDNGNLLRTAAAGGLSYFFGGIIEEFNWEGELVWSYEINNDEFIQHHDIEPLPNGNILALCYNFKEPIDAWVAGAQDTLEYWSTSIFEIQPLPNNQANIVWEWHLWDHLVQNIDSTRQNYSEIIQPELFDINEMIFPNDSTFVTVYVDIGPDWMHMNSIDYNEERDEILLSSRDHNEIFILDHSTSTEEASSHSGGTHDMGGDFIYRFGREQFYGQHDAHWINRSDYHDDAIVVFNNGFRHDDMSRGYSSVDYLIPKVGMNGKYVHDEVDTFEVLLKLDGEDREFSSVMGSAQILDDDRILICNSSGGWFLEFDIDRNLKWKYESPLTFDAANQQGNPNLSPLIFRAKRLSVDHPAFMNDWNLGNPIELDFNIDDCLGITSVDDADLDDYINIYPNPTNQHLHIETQETINALYLYDSVGRIHKPNKISSNKWNVQHIPSGAYIAISMTNQGAKFMNKVIIQ